MSELVADATVLLGLNETGVAFESRAWWVATSDRNGLYEFAGRPTGPFVLIAAKAGYVGWDSIPVAVRAPIVALRRVPALAFVMSAPRLAIDLVPGGRVCEATVTLHRPASVSGRAVYPDGSPAAKERVTLYTPDQTGAIASRRDGLPTDARGAYAFGDLRPGTYYLGLPPPGRLQDLDPSALTPVTV